MHRQRAWIYILVEGSMLIGVYLLMPTTLAYNEMYSCIGISSVVLIILGVHVNKPTDPTAWYLLAAGGALFSIGDLIVDYYTDIVHLPIPVPSIADPIYLIGYPFLFAGVMRLSRGPDRRARRENNADAAIIALGALTIACYFLLNSYVHQSGLSLLGRLVALTYPIMDVTLVFVLFRSVIFGGTRKTYLWLPVAGMTVMLAGDISFDLLSIHNAYKTGSFVDELLLFEYVLVAAAAFHPSVRPAPESDAEQVAHRRRTDDADAASADWKQSTSGRRLPFVAFAAFVPPPFLAVTSVSGPSVNFLAVAVLCVGVFILIALRMVWILRRVGDQALDLERHARELEGSHRERDTLAASEGQDGSESGISMSIGLPVTDSPTGAEELIGEADAAMFRSKAAGHSRITLFAPDMRVHLTERHEIIKGFRNALERGEFSLAYQPVLALHDLHVNGFEALARWNHPTLGKVPPSVFIPIAEETGFITALGRWVLLEATRQLVECSGITDHRLRVAVNLSRRHLPLRTSSTTSVTPWTAPDWHLPS